MYFSTCELWKRLLDKYLKRPVSDDASTTNMMEGPKHCSNLEDSTFSIFIDYCDCNSVGKSLS